MHQGNKHVLIITVPDADLTEYSEIAWEAARVESGPTVVRKTLSGGGIVVETPHEMHVRIYPMDTRDQLPGRYYHEATVFDADGAPVTILAEWGEIKFARIKILEEP